MRGGWRRLGTAVLVLAGLGFGFVLAWRGYGMDKAVAVATGAAVLVPVAVVAIPWVIAGWTSGSTAAHAQLNDIAGELAGVVRRQWLAEARARQLTRSRLLAVEWGPAGPHAGSIAGSVTDVNSLARAFLGLADRHLVIVGEPGTGKTTLALLLTIALCEQHERNDPVPVLMSPASWDAGREHLLDWLERRLRLEYPMLAAIGANGATIARDLIDDRRVVPILDGLDELPDARRQLALKRIDEVLLDDDALVVTCRTQEYRAALESMHPLSRMAAIGPRPLRVEMVIDYLRAAPYGDRDGGERWKVILEHLRKEPSSPLGGALSNMLLVSLARQVYAGPRSNPAELVDRARFPNQTAIEEHLLEALVRDALDSERRQSRPQSMRHARQWDPDRARRWLTVLAKHLNRLGTRDLLWWQLYRETGHAARWAVVWLFGGVTTGCVFGVSAGLTVPGAVSRFYRIVFVGVVFATYASIGMAGAVVSMATGTLRRAWAPISRRLSYPLDRVERRLAVVGRRVTVWSVTHGAPAWLIDASQESAAQGYSGEGPPAQREPVRASLRLHGRIGALAGSMARQMALAGALGALGAIASLIGVVWMRWPWGLEWDALYRAPALGLGIAAVAGAVGGILDWMGIPSSTHDVVEPRSILDGDRLVTLMALTATLSSAVVSYVLGARLLGTIVGLTMARSTPSVSPPIASYLTKVTGPIVAGMSTSVFAVVVFVVVTRLLGRPWLSYAVTRSWLALRGQLPWLLMGFLADMRELGLLRQLGPAYQFRHANLQDHLSGERVPDPEVLADFHRAIGFDHASPWALALRAESSLRVRQYDRALADFGRALRLDRNHTWALAHRGETHRRMGLLAAAVADLDRAIALDPDYAWAIARRGQAHRDANRLEAALSDFDRAVELAPTDSWILARRGATLRALGRNKEALIDLDRAVLADPADAWALAMRADVLIALDRYEDALHDLGVAIELDPTVQWPILQRADVRGRLGLFEEAIADYKWALKLDPNSVDAIAGRGLIYRRMGRYEEAVADLDRVLDLDPGDDWLRYCRAMSLRCLGRDADIESALRLAIADGEEGLERHPDHSWRAFKVGLYHAAIGEWEEAERCYRQGLELPGDERWSGAALADLDDLRGLMADDGGRIDALQRLFATERAKG